MVSTEVLSVQYTLASHAVIPSNTIPYSVELESFMDQLGAHAYQTGLSNKLEQKQAGRATAIIHSRIVTCMVY